MAKKKNGFDIPEVVDIEIPEAFTEVIMQKWTSIKGIGVLQVGRIYTLPTRIAESLIKEKAAISK